MRTTKALVCAAAVAAGALSAVAQSNVYSLNVVGYINVPVQDGWNLVANQLDLDGTGTNNTIVSVFTNSLPVNSKIQTWNGSGFNTATWAKNKTTGLTNWSVNLPLNPGMGLWLNIPAGTYGATTGAVTTVGQVLQGALVNPNMPSLGGWTLLSSMTPVAGGLSSSLNYTPQLNDKVQVWNGSGFNTYTYAKNKTTGLTNWGTAGEPQISVGQGFWLNTSAGAGWSNYFIVQ